MYIFTVNSLSSLSYQKYDNKPLNVEDLLAYSAHKAKFYSNFFYIHILG